MSAGLSLESTLALLDASVDGVVVYAPDMRVVYWNASMESLTGLRAADVVGHDALQLFPFLKEIGEDIYLRRALAGDSVTSYDRPYSIPGTSRHGFFEGHYRPLRGAGGEVDGVIGIIRDVTARKKAELQLVETETRFRNMADVAPVLLWMSGTDGLCTFFNQTWLTFTGRTLEQEWGVGWAEGIHFEDFQRCMDTYLAAFNARRVFEMEYRLRRSDGEYRWILDRGTPRYTPDGAFAGFIGSCVDITERKQLEADLRQAVQARDEFLSVASHELKTPLTSLLLQIDRADRLLARGGDHAIDRVKEAVVATTDAASRMAELVEVLLDVSRIGAGRLDLRPTALDLAQLASRVAERWRDIAAKVGSSLVLECAAPVHGSWDPLRLEQVVNNLLSNAVKYGAGTPIALQVAAAGGTARLQVTDGGVGIDTADHARIFERFERASSTRNYGGLGLGLWITRQIVSAMGGDIRVSSAPGRGASFTVELPATPP